jgi:hypothetical protein
VLETVVKNPTRPHPPLIVVNTGAMRFDIFAGNFTVNDELITMPFSNTFMYVPDVPRSIAEEFVRTMNQGKSFKVIHRISFGFHFELTGIPITILKVQVV